MLTAIWYANVLSGYNTQIVNFGSNAVNMVLLYSVAVAQNPKNAVFISNGLINGIKRGWLEGKDTFKTGYSPIKGKAEIPPLLEMIDFKGGKFNPANYLKYVRRAMVAADVVFFEGIKEMRAYQMAKMQAAKEGKSEPTLNQLNRAIEIVGRSDRQLETIKNEVDLENEKEFTKIEESDLTEKEKAELVKSVLGDRERRIYDMVEQQRGIDMVQETAEFAAEGTYNYPPKGLLGAVASGINAIISKVPLLRLAVPFTNIIANVANETINYTPIAFTRLKKGGWTDFRRDELTEQKRADLLTKAILGTTLMTTAMVLSQVGGDDDDKPYMEITGNGTGDYAKNEILKKEGWSPYSFRVKKMNGEYSDWYSFQYTPLIATLGYIGHYNDLTKYKDGDERDVIEKLSMAAGLTTLSFFQNTFLDNLGNVLASVLDPRSSDKIVDKAIKGAIGAAKGVILPNLITQTTQELEGIFDIPKKEIKGEGYRGLLGTVLQDIPYARNIYYDKINILGDPIMYDLDKFHSKSKPDKIISLLVDKKSVFAPINRKAEKVYDMETGEERALTDEEFYNYSVAKGQYIKNALTNGYKDYKFEDFDKMSNGKFKKELTKIKTKATEEARLTIGDVGKSLFTIEVNDEEEPLSIEQVLLRKGIVKKYVDENKEAYYKELKDSKLTKKQIEGKLLLDAVKVSGFDILEKYYKVDRINGEYIPKDK